MNQRQNEKTVPRRKNNTKKNRSNVSVIKVAGLTVMLLFLILAAAFFMNNLPQTSTVKDDVDSDVFYSINSDTVRDIVPYSDGVAVLSASSVKYLDAAGNEIITNTHSYANPQMAINSKNLLLFDRGGYSLRIESNAVEYSSFTFDSVITTAAIGKKGNYAYVLNSDNGYQSHLYIYSLKGSKQFEWGSASDYIVDVALSDNGKYAAVTLLGINGAEYFSKIILFKFNSSEPVYNIEFYDTTVYDIDFVSGKKLSVYSDSGVFLIDSHGEYTCTQSYSSSEMSYSSIYYNGLSCTLISLYGNEKEPLLTVFDKKGKQKYTSSFLKQVTGVYCSKNYVAVVLDNAIEILNTDGTLVGNIVLEETSIKTLIAGRRVYALTASGLYSFSVNSNNQSYTSSIETTLAQ